MSRISNVGTGGSGSGSGTPGGSTTQVQFNDGGSFGGDAGLVYDKTTDTLTLGNLVLNTDLPLTEGGTGASTAVGARANLGLIIGTDVQSYSANLDEYAAVNPTAAGLALLDDANAAAQLITLGLTATATELNYTDGVTSAIQTQLDAKAADSAVVHDTGDETIAGVKTFSSDPIIPDEAYGAGWNGSLEPATKNAIYDKVETIVAGAGEMQHLIFTAKSNAPPASAFATLDTRNSHTVLDYDGATDEEGVFEGVLPSTYTGGGLTIDTYWAFTSATSGSLRVQSAIERIDASSLDIDADSFASFNSAGGTAPGTNGQVIKVTTTHASGAEMDSLAAGEAFRLKIRRDADGTSGTDDIATDAELLRVVVKET